MKKPAIVFIIFLKVFLSFLKNSSAQNLTYPIVSMSIETVPISRDTSGGIPDLSDSTIFSTQMYVSLFDTTSINEMYVVLSGSGAINTRLQHTFNWDVFGSTGSGTSYARTEYYVALGLGEFSDLLHYTAALRIKRIDGTFTDYVTFSR
jgi:hypothetical protein